MTPPVYWMPLLTSDEINETVFAVEDALIVVQVEPRRTHLLNALASLQALQADILKREATRGLAAVPVGPDLQPPESFPQRQPGWPLSKEVE